MPVFKISGLTTATAVSATNQFEINQNGASRSATLAQVATYARGIASDVVVLPAGTSAATALAPTGDPNTGIIFPAADTIAFIEGGTEAMRIDSSGNVGIGRSPVNKLDVEGGVTFRGASEFITTAVTQSWNTSVDGGITIANAVARMDIGLTSTGARIFVFEDNPLTLVTGGSDRVTISGEGLVGVTAAFGRGAPVTKTGNFTVAVNENWIICNGTGTITVTLPTASAWTGREIMLKTIAAQTVISATSNVVPLAGGAVGTAILPATAGAWVTLVSNGVFWVIMQA
jgi:hypothetical protein